MAKVNPIQAQKFLKGVDYPTSKEDLLKHVEREGADKNVREAFAQLPDMQYEAPTDVSEALGKLE